MMFDPYKVLGVLPNASDEERSEERRVGKECH